MTWLATSRVPRLNRKHSKQFILACCSAYLLGFALLTLGQSPCLGVADIQDFWRVMRPAGIEHFASLTAPGYFVVCEFKTGPADFFSGPSSSALLAMAAKHLGFWLRTEPGVMDLRQMGLLYLLLSTLVLLSGLRAGFPPVLALLILYVIVDPGYLLFFNSFYADGSLFIALIGAVVWLERHGGSPESLGGKNRRSFFLSLLILASILFLGGASRMQYIPFPMVFLAAHSATLAGLARANPRRALALVAVNVAVGLVATLSFFVGSSPNFIKYNNYHALYGGILRVSSDPGRVFDRLGVSSEFRLLPRTDVWSAGIPRSHPIYDHLEDFSRAQLLWLYATDPPAISAMTRAIAHDLTRVESHPRGNYAQDSPRVRKRTYQTWWQYSRLSRPVLRLWPPAVWGLLAAALGWMGITGYVRGWQGLNSAMLFLLLWVLSQCVVVVLGEGQINLLQHLVGARLGFDLLTVLLAADFVGTMVRKTRGAIRPKVG